MYDEQHVVVIAEEKVLVYREGGDWFWRGADWTSHMGSFGGFLTKEEAIDSAQRRMIQDLRAL